jgi:carbohydrate-selective porin OprB
MRYLILLLPVVLVACATPGTGSGMVLVETGSNGQALEGANCLVSTNAGNWNVTTPVTVPVGSASGDLRVTCNKGGYRTSEVIYRPSSPTNSNVGIGIGGGGGHVGVGLGLGIPITLGSGYYPSRITVDMNPQ